MSQKLNKNKLNSEDRQKIASSGMDFSEETRSASFLQEDDNVLLSGALDEGVDIMPMEKALEEYPDAEKYYGKAFEKAGKHAPSDTKGGYFIRVKKGHDVKLPIQACLFLKKLGAEQRVHNLIIVEEGASAYLITGCSSSKSATESFHLGVSEFFIKKGGYLSFTMIHSWDEEVVVKPKSVAILEEEANYVSNYICLKPVREVVMYPTAILEGEKAKASFNSLILSHPGTVQDIGSRTVLKAPFAQSEIISRAVSLGGKVIARGHLLSESPETRGHLECRGLVISKKGMIHAIPELETELRDVDLSHEAAIGRISNEEIEYLQSRGMTADEAQSVIIRGFMDVRKLGLPEELNEEIKKMEERTLNSGV